MNGPPVLDLYDEVDREVPLKGKRWVIAHINDFSPKDVERIVRMGLVITTHTNNYLYKGLHVHAKRLPPERHGEIVAAAQPARRRREGVARDRQRADHELPADLAHDPAHELRDQSSGSRRRRR